MTERNFQVDIKSHDKVMGELKDLARQIDKGDYPATPFERVYFNDTKTFFRHITPRRFDLLEELHRQGEMSINALARLLKRRDGDCKIIQKPFTKFDHPFLMA